MLLGFYWRHNCFEDRQTRNAGHSPKASEVQAFDLRPFAIFCKRNYYDVNSDYYERSLPYIPMYIGNISYMSVGFMARYVF